MVLNAGYTTLRSILRDISKSEVEKEKKLELFLPGASCPGSYLGAN